MKFYNQSVFRHILGWYTQVISNFITLPSHKILQSSSENPTVQDPFYLILLDAILDNEGWRDRCLAFRDGVLFIRMKEDD